MMNETASEAPIAEEKSPDPRLGMVIPFHYIKSTAFRVVHADGVVGGITPRGDCSMSFFSERLPIPNSVYHSVQEGGKLGQEIESERVSKHGLIREVDFCATFDIATARVIRDWLTKRIDQHDEAVRVTESAKEKN